MAEMADEQLQEQKNSIVVYLQVYLVNSERQISFATYSNTLRQFQTGILNDNEHYSSLQALLIQFNPKDADSQFAVYCLLPQLSSERKKLLDKIGEYYVEGADTYKCSGNVEPALQFLLKRSYNLYTKEIQHPKCLTALDRLIEVLGVTKDLSNKGQFDLKLAIPSASMMLDQSTINALQIFPKQMQKKLISSNNTLYEILNKCKTSSGTRCLKRWMKQPLQDPTLLNIRLDKLEYFIKHNIVKSLIQNQLKKLPDLDRLYFVFYKVAAGKKSKCEVSDLIKIYRTIEAIQELVNGLDNKRVESQVVEEIYTQLQKNVKIISKVSQMIERTIDMSSSRENEFFVKASTQPSLDTIMNEIKQIDRSINTQLKVVAEHLGTQVQKNVSSTYRYVFEACKKYAISKVKETTGYKFLTAKQTKITFTTETLVKLCERLRIIEQEYKNEQQTVLKKMFTIVAGYYPIMQQLSFLLGELDVITTLASVVNTTFGNWCRPKYSDHLIGTAMRHLCVKDCVANSCHMDTNRTIVLTGPNMGGKSTYIRTVGLCVYLAHLGCYVPALTFQTPIIDAIITRVGASDLQLKGISTFMSEMLESACMLQIATNRSLVLIDELGRGTSTCQGFGIAWGICDYLHTHVKPYCLFATHFHEMTHMAHEIPGVKNMYTACSFEGDRLILQYEVTEGCMQKSYGIEVMRMLNFPQEVIDQAIKYLEYYENEGKIKEKYPDQLKEQIADLYEAMCKEIQGNSQQQQSIRANYKRRIKYLLKI